MSAAARNPLPALDPATEAALRESIRRFGVLVPVLRDELGELVDGHHRVRIAAELGVKCPEHVVVELPDDPDERAAALASVNDDRRQRMSPERRRELVTALREAGHSQRTIADAVGVSQSTVRDDVKQVSTPTHPDRVTGRDGKSYPAVRPPRPPADVIDLDQHRAREEHDAAPGDDDELIERAERALERHRAREPPEPEDAAVRARLKATAHDDPARADAIWRRTLELHGVHATAAQAAAVAADMESPDVLGDIKRFTTAARKAIRAGDSRAARQALAIWRATVYRELDRIARESS